MKTLVVTGGIGSGKSLLCSFLAERGVPVYDSDSRTKSLYDTDSTLPYRISEAVGADVTDPAGRIDRKKLASTVFADASRLNALEAVVHPAVLEDFRKWKSGIEAQIAGHPDSSSDFVVFESAIILQKPFFRNFGDIRLLVDAPLETRIARACARDASSREAVLERMSHQKLLNDISEGRVKPEVDCVIVNDGTAEELHSKVEQFIKNFIHDK